MNFIEWFQLKQKYEDPTKLRECLITVSPQDIKKWIDQTNPKLTTLSIPQAAKQTQSFLQKQNQQNINKKANNLRNFVKNKNKEDNTLRKQYKGKKCSLNGYPAYIIESKTLKIPIVISKQPKNQVIHKNWHSIHKYYPHFAGGKIYELTDDQSIINKKITKELKRNNQ